MRSIDLRKVGESIAMGVIAVLMCIAFARTNATGCNNLFWTLVFLVAVGASILWLNTEYGWIPAVVKQLVLSLSLVIFWGVQSTLIANHEIPETCCITWLNFLIAFLICTFNIVVCIVDWEEDDDEGGEDAVGPSALLAVISGIVLICGVYQLLNLI